MIISLLKTILYFLIVPFLIGTNFTSKTNNNYKLVERAFFYYTYGITAVWALFEILCVPMALLQVRFHLLVDIFTIIVLVLSLFSLLKLIYTKHNVFGKNKTERKYVDKNGVICMLITIVLVGIQAFFIVYYQSNWMTLDDAEYVTRTSASIYTDYIVSNGVNGCDLNFIAKRSLCSWEIYIAWLCKVTGLNVPTMVHTVLNILLFLIAYMVFYMFGCELFDNFFDRITFVAVIAFVNLFGLYSHYSLTFRWLMTMWQGKAVFMVIILHLVFLFLLRLIKNGFRVFDLTILTILSVDSCALTPTGAGMFAGVVFLVVLLYSISERKIIYIFKIWTVFLFPVVFMMTYLFCR